MKSKEHYVFIYLLTIKTNNLIYVGQTTDLTRRKKEYRNKIHQFNKSNNYRCMNEIRKVGYDNLKFEILDYADSKEELNQKEIFWIDKLDSTNPDIGLNVKAGGAGGFMSQDYLDKNDLSKRTLNIHTPEVKRKKSKRIIAFKDKEAMIFDGAKLFGDKFDFARTNVTAVIKGKGIKLGGYYLFYLDDIKELQSLYETRKQKPNIKNNEYIKLYDLVIEGVEAIENNGYKIIYEHYQ